MSKIKIVTAFFDIGRGTSSVLPRNNEQYFDYFKFWSRIQNEMIVYCEPQNCEKIINIRREYGLEEKTEVIPIPDVFHIEPEIFAHMTEIEHNKQFHSFRYYNKALSNSAKYDYIMLIKWWCLNDAAARSDDDYFLAWIDFGYNHGGERYTKSEDFDFLWDYPFADKVNAFCLSNPDDMTGVDSLQFQKDCFIGHTVVMPQNMCAQWWNRIKEAMWSLISLDCIDDDQQLLLMVYKRYKNDFNIMICDWFEDFLLCSNQSFTVKRIESQSILETEKQVKLSIARRIYRKLKRSFIKEKQETPRMDPFLQRMLEKKKKYYG